MISQLQVIISTILKVLTGLTGHGQHALEDEFLTFTNGRATSTARIKITSVSPRTVTLLVLILILLLNVIPSFGQKYKVLGSTPGTTVVCPAGHKNVNSRVGIPGQNELMAQMQAAATRLPRTSEIQVIFRGAAAEDPGFKRACRYAAIIWERYLVSPVPIVISVGFENLNGFAGSARPTSLITLEDDAYPGPRVLPVALANSLVGRDLKPGEPDVIINVSDEIYFYYGTDGNPWFWQFDFVTLILHEIGHGLGFVTHNFINSNGGWRSNPPYRFDDFLKNPPGLMVTDIPNGSALLADFYTSNNLVINGPVTRYRFGGHPRLYAPHTHGVSSISHWDEGSFPPGNSNSLMTPIRGINEVIHEPGTITLGLFADLGWTIYENGHFTADNIIFKVTSSPLKTVMAVEYLGPSGAVTIPETVGGHTVTSIGTAAFQNNQLTSVTLGQDVTSIENHAFQFNRLQGHLEIPNGVTSIGYTAFGDNQLTSVTIPNSVTSIGDWAFAVNQINKIWALGSTPPNLGGANAFQERAQIDVVVPKGNPPGSIKAAYKRAWGTEFNSITEVGEVNHALNEAFTADHITYRITGTTPNRRVSATNYNTDGGSAVDIPDMVQYQDIDYAVTAIGNDAFRNNQLTSVEIPTSVTSIGSYAFYNNNRLTKVTIPSSVTSIGEHAFDFNRELRHVKVEATSPPTIHENTFWPRNKTDLAVPKGTRATYLANGWSGFRSVTEIPEVGSTFVVGHITYKVTTVDNFNNNRQVMAIDYHTAGGPIVNIPRTVDNGLNTYKVTAIGNEAFKEKRLTQVNIYGMMTSIGDNAFANNRLTKVDIYRNALSIGQGAFRNNRLTHMLIPIGVTVIEDDVFRDNQLTSVTILGRVTSIGDNAFQYNQLKGHLEIPNSVTSIGYAAFGDNQLTSVTIPGGVTHIGEAAFAVNELGSVTIPSSVTSIPNYAFQNNQLTSVTLPNNLTSIGTHAFQNNQLTSVTLPNNLKTIGNSAFWHNDLAEVTLPVNVTKIDQWAFWDNLNLAMVTAKPANPPKLDSAAFTNRGQIDLVVPRGKKDVYLGRGWTGFNSIIEVGHEFTVDGITYQVIGPLEVEAHDYDGSMGRDVIIPETVSDQGQGVVYTVTAIGQDAFREKGLKEVTIPNGVTSIGSHAFQYNQLKGHLEIPNNVTSIGEAAFGDNQLTRVTIPGGVTHIRKAAFAVNQLDSVTIPSSVTSIPNYAFQNNQLTSVTLPNSLETIGNSAFWHNNLTEVTLPGNVTKIDQWAFWDNLNLAMVTVKAESPPTLDSAAFKDRHLRHLVVPRGKKDVYLSSSGSSSNDWTGFKSIVGVDEEFTVDHITYRITEITSNSRKVSAIGYNTTGDHMTIPGTVKYEDIDYAVTAIGNNAFREKGLEEVTIPGEVTAIGDSAFAHNKLTSIYIPNKVTSIGSHAFAYNELTGVMTLPNSVTSIEVAAFAVNQLDTVIIPSSVTSIPNYAFQNNQLRSVTLPNNLTSIGTHAFQNNQLTEVTLPNNLKTIGNSAFWDNDLIEVTLPGNVTRIEQWAFWDNLNLVTVRAKPGSPPILDSAAFKDRDLIHLFVPRGKEDVYLSSGWRGFNTTTEVAQLDDEFTVDYITYKITSQDPNPNTVRAKAFDNTTGGSTTVNIPSTVKYQNIDYAVTTIGNNAFKEKLLTGVIFASPSNVAHIGNNAFQGNELTSVEIPNSVTHIGMGAFVVNKLESVDISSGLTRIEAAVFSHNQLIEVTIPGGVTNIGGNAFTHNPIKTVTAQASIPPGIQTSTFQNQDQIDVVVPRGNPAGNIKIEYESTWGTDFKSITEVAEVNDTLIADHITYRITGITPNRKVTAIDYNTTGGHTVSIPDTVQYQNIDYAVTAIGDDAFRNNQLEGVEIPGGVISIEERAFMDNPLASVDIPNSVTTIGDYAFWNSKLTNLTLPGSVTHIGEGAFGSTEDLVSVEAQATDPPSLGQSAFTSRNSIDLVVPTGKRQEYLDNGWTSFKSITYGIFTGQDIKYGIISPTEVEIIDYLGNETGVTIEGEVTYKNIRYNVTAIGQWAFAQNDLEEVTIPANVDSIGYKAFYGNNNLKLVTVKADEPPALHADAFQGVHNDLRNQVSLIVPRDKKDVYLSSDWTGFNSTTEVVQLDDEFTADHITYQITSLDPNPNKVRITSYDNTTGDSTTVTIPDTVQYQNIDYAVTAIGDNAFREKGLTEVTIPDGVTTIGEGAFQVNLLGSVVIPNSVISIGSRAFQWNHLTEVTISENITSIEAHVFQNNRLSSVVIPNSVTRIHRLAFQNNTLTEVTLGENVTRIEYNAFRDNQLKSVVIPNSVTRIEHSAFRDNQLTSVIFGENVTEIEKAAFFGNKLNSVTIPNSVTSIGGAAFQANELTEVIFSTPSNLTSIGEGVFKNNKLESFEIPNSVTSVGNSAFSQNQLISVTIPSSVTDIEQWAFANSTGKNINTIFVGATTPPSIEENTFRDRGKINVIVPRDTPAESIKNAYKQAWGTDFASIKEGIEVLIDDTPAQRNDLTPFSVTITFKHDVTGFTQQDIAGNLVNATVVDNSFSLVTGSTSAYNVQLRPTVCEGTITIDIPGGVAEYAPNFPNLAAITTTVTVNATPSAPSVSSSPVEYCVGETANPLTATGANLLWYTSRTDERGDASAPTPTTTAAGSTSYYVNQSVDGCESERAEIEVIVKATPSAPSVNNSSVEYCVGQPAEALTATGDNLLWYTSRTDETGDASAPTPNTATADTTFHYVSQTNSNGCQSERTEIVVTVETCSAQIGDGFTVAGMDYEITSVDPYTVAVTGRSSATPPAGAITIPGTVTYEKITYTATAIGANAFNDTPDLDLVTVEATHPPSLHENALTGRGQVDLVVPAGTREDYLKEGWTGFRSITSGIFTDKDIKYGITSVNPNEVEIIDYIGSATAVEIPETVDDKDETYAVTAIGANAFSDNPDLATVKIEATHLLSIHADAFADRSQVDLVVPTGMRQAYLENGWDGFSSITEEQVVTAIHNYEFKDFTVYPNPARDKVYIDIDPRSGQELKQVNIYTMDRAYLFSENGPVINTTRLPRGTYLFEIVTKTGDRSMRKVIIQ